MTNVADIVREEIQMFVFPSQVFIKLGVKYKCKRFMIYEYRELTTL